MGIKFFKICWWCGDWLLKKLRVGSTGIEKTALNFDCLLLRNQIIREVGILRFQIEKGHIKSSHVVGIEATDTGKKWISEVRPLCNTKETWPRKQFIECVGVPQHGRNPRRHLTWIWNNGWKTKTRKNGQKG